VAGLLAAADCGAGVEDEMNQARQNLATLAGPDKGCKMVMAPVMEKARKAIEEVAKENGLLYVFDMTQGNPIYASEESMELLPLVKAKLGLQ